jgi:hypothetical protein
MKPTKKNKRRPSRSRAGKPPSIDQGGKRRFGALRGEIKIGKGFHEPLPEVELKRWQWL